MGFRKRGDEAESQLPLVATLPKLSDDAEEQQIERTGSAWSASAHIITAVIGSGVLSLAWSVGQLGLIGGPIVMICFAAMTLVQSSLLADCYRSPDPVNGHIRNRTFMDAVRLNLGEKSVWICGVFQQLGLIGVAVAYTITSSTSLRTFLSVVQKNCVVCIYTLIHHPFRICAYTFINCICIICIYILLRALLCTSKESKSKRGEWQLSTLLRYLKDTLKSPPAENKTMKKASMASILITTFFYLCCGCFGYAAFGDDTPGNLLTGFGFYEPYWLIDFANACIILHLVGGYQVMLQNWASTSTYRCFSCYAASSYTTTGLIAFAYPYSVILLEIQDTLKSPPAENKTMKKASMASIMITTFFYLCCGCFGYAAFGDDTPGNLLTGFGFYEPYWLIDFANACIILHLVGGYQVFSQPIFAFVERWFAQKYHSSSFMNDFHTIHLWYVQPFRVKLFRLCFRTLYVVSTTGLAIAFPYFNQVLALLGSFNFWPLGIYFPVEMYFIQKNIAPWTSKWILLQVFSVVCLLVSMFALIGSIEGIFSERLK
ncbi:amino acid permease 3-like [Phalaenopsis equestris]|uniref:amino acid permease 3-like n=1 Tax=Phalaenopsis equestris TaxID=78828 RepID=UPI0009E30BB1|nr:amino acid permease 3-like [Phalaenopsis equestris]